MSRRRRRYVDWAGLQRVVLESLREAGFGGVSIDGKMRYVEDGLNHDSYLFAVDGDGLPDDLAEDGGVLRMPIGEGAAFRSTRREDDLDRTELEAVMSIRREMQTLRQLEHTSFPYRIPRVICPLTECRGFIESLIPGMPFEALKGAPNVRALFDTIGRTAAAVHGLGTAEFSHLPGHDNAAEHVRQALDDSVTPQVLSAYPAAKRAHDWILSHLPEGRPSVVLHGDLLPQNFLVVIGPTLETGLVDWEYARIGDPAYDLAIVTRGRRKVLGIGGALEKLLRVYNEASDFELTQRDVRIHELILNLSWLSSSCVEQKHGADPPEIYAQRIGTLLRRVGASEKKPAKPAGERARDGTENGDDDSLKHVKIYTDGAADPNPGPGGYGTLLIYNGHRRELSGGYRRTTNNRMEMLAVIRGFEALKHRCRVTVYTDSKYVRNAIAKGWAERWRANGWKRNRTDHAKNPDMWARLLDLCALHEVKFKWVPGHAGHAENERCDVLAKKARKKRNLPVDEGFERGE